VGWDVNKAFPPFQYRLKAFLLCGYITKKLDVLGEGVLIRLYESIVQRLHTGHEVSNLIKIPFWVNQGFLLSPTLFMICINEIESFLHEHIECNDSFLLHHFLIFILVFSYDLVLLDSTFVGLQR
jgi:hypothetical protein